MSTWIGFIAVGQHQPGPSGTDAEDIAVVFRGTSMTAEWFWNLSAGQTDPM